jgi:signal peptidase II
MSTNTPQNTPRYEYPTTEFDAKPRQSFGLGYRALLLLISIVVIVLDRITKLFIVHHFANHRVYTIIPGILRITHVQNTGAAFSMFAESASPTTVRHILILFSVAAALIIFVMLWRVGRSISISSVALALILGGALGNLYDRVVYHYVVDFIGVRIYHYHWPDFNVADSCIVIGACLLVIEIFRPQPIES